MAHVPKVVSWAVLLAGIVTVVLVLAFHNGTAPSASPTQTTTKVHARPSKDASNVAREFLETAVLRKRLHYAYTLVAPPLKAGISRQQWETGSNNPVISYSADNARTARLRVLDATARELYLRVSLLSKTERPATFYMELVRQKAGNWLVDYFEASGPYRGVLPPR